MLIQFTIRNVLLLWLYNLTRPGLLARFNVPGIGSPSVELILNPFRGQLFINPSQAAINSSRSSYLVFQMVLYIPFILVNSLFILYYHIPSFPSPPSVHKFSTHSISFLYTYVLIFPMPEDSPSPIPFLVSLLVQVLCVRHTILRN